MLQIQITAHKNLPAPERMLAEFGEQGGNIGRAVGNALVLPDPARHISRTHAAISFRNGQYVIRDLGTVLPVIVNGRTLGNGNHTTLNLGDEISIGGYTLRVAATDAPPLTARTSPLEAPSSPVDENVAVEDPLATLGKGDAPDPFADLLGPLTTPATPPPVKPASTRPQAAPSTTKPANAPVQLIPEDFDPFAEPKPPAEHVDELPDDLQAALGPKSSEPSIDQLFGLEAGGGNGQPDTFGMTSEPAEQRFNGEATSSLDPMVLLGLTSNEKPTPTPQRDDMSEMQRAYRPPQARPEKPKSSTPTSAKSRQKVSEGANGDDFDMMLSWENGDSGNEVVSTRVVPPPKTERPRGTTARAEIEVNLAAHPRTAAADARGPSSPPSPSISQGTANTNNDELLRALLAGAGVVDLKVAGGLTPEMMMQIGQLLREATQGTLDLLLARALTKREVRLDMTMISSRDNNPLKFSPSVEVALAQMLTPPKRGFMTPVAAMKDAYDDLRSHQFGFMAGMRAALAGVLERLNPVQLEPRLKQKSMLDTLVPMNRKAKLWDLFVEYYQDIAKDVEDDFHTLFGKEFLRAYEAQIAKLEQEDNEKR